MSIEGAVGQFVDHVNGEFSSGTESLGGLIQDAVGQVNDIATQITSEGETLRSQVDSLLSRAGDAVDSITTGADEFVNSAEQATQTAADAIDQDNEVMDSARTVVEQLDQGVLALIPEADEIASAVEQTIGTMAESIDTTEKAMDEVRAATEEYLRNPFAELTETVQTEIFDRGSELGQYITSDLLPGFATEVDQYKSYADEAADTARQKLDELAADAESQGSEMLSQVQDMFGEEFGSLIETAETVADLIDRVGQAITGTTEVVGTTMDTLSQGVNLTAIGAKSAIGIVEDIIEIFNSVT